MGSMRIPRVLPREPLRTGASPPDGEAGSWSREPRRVDGLKVLRVESWLRGCSLAISARIGLLLENAMTKMRVRSCDAVGR